MLLIDKDKLSNYCLITNISSY